MLKQAFILQVHKDFNQICGLISLLSYGDIYIHVDLRSEQLYNQLYEKYKESSNVFIITKRYKVVWSSFNQVLATLSLLESVKNKKNRYDYIHFISGQDLPIKSQDEIDSVLIKNGLDQQYIQCHPIASWKWRVKNYSFFRNNPYNRTLFFRIIDNGIRLLQKILLMDRTNFPKYSLYMGASWFSITQEFSDYIIEYCKSTDYLDNFTYTACSDEHFFQILIMHSPFKEFVNSNILRLIEFNHGESSPKTWTMDDKHKLETASMLFARKFDPETDNTIIKYYYDKLKPSNTTH